jgi:hypothetical protein
MEEKLYKRYVDVVALYTKKSEITPLFIMWDGKKYQIQRVFEKHIARSPVGGGGMRYSIMIQNQHRYLYLEKDRWFLESTKPLQYEEYEPEYLDG